MWDCCSPPARPFRTFQNKARVSSNCALQQPGSRGNCWNGRCRPPAAGTDASTSTRSLGTETEIPRTGSSVWGERTLLDQTVEVMLMMLLELWRNPVLTQVFNVEMEENLNWNCVLNEGTQLRNRRKLRNRLPCSCLSCKLLLLTVLTILVNQKTKQGSVYEPVPLFSQIWYRCSSGIRICRQHLTECPCLSVRLKMSIKRRLLSMLLCCVYCVASLFCLHPNRHNCFSTGARWVKGMFSSGTLLSGSKCYFSSFHEIGTISGCQ